MNETGDEHPDGHLNADVRYIVPLYQRSYVWKEEEHWRPLWEDILVIIEHALAGEDEFATHFLGAIVLHRLFDLGFVTVLPDRTFAVSRQLRDDYANGRTYYALEGRRIAVPRDARDWPDPTALEWHSREVFRGS